MSGFAKFVPNMNITYTLRVSDLEGRSVESRFGKDQVLLRVDVIEPKECATTGASWYTYPWIVEKLKAQGAKPGVPFRYCSAQLPGGKSELRISTDVTGIDESDLERDLRVSREMTIARRAANAPANAVTPMPTRTVDPEPTVHTLASEAMAGCLIAAIDASLSAAAYAQRRGVNFAPSSSDLKEIAATLFIQMTKVPGGLNAMSPSPEQKQLVNGGTRWAQ